jgi:hypothetical protein
MNAPVPGLNRAAQPCEHQRQALPRRCAKIKQKGKTVPRFLTLSLIVALGAGPALAAETCDQALKDTTAGSKTAIIAPKETAKVADLVKEAEPLCKGDAQQQAEGIALLRVARSMIGE